MQTGHKIMQFCRRIYEKKNLMNFGFSDYYFWYILEKTLPALVVQCVMQTFGIKNRIIANIFLSLNELEFFCIKISREIFRSFECIDSDDIIQLRDYIPCIALP